MWKDFTENSKLSWGINANDNNKTLSLEQIQLGCLLRIANSLENMGTAL